MSCLQAQINAASVCMAVVGSVQRLAAPLFLPTGRRLCSSSVGKEEYDLVVVGGGMVGSALACSVGKLSIMHPSICYAPPHTVLEAGGFEELRKDDQRHFHQSRFSIPVTNASTGDILVTTPCTFSRRTGPNVSISDFVITCSTEQA